MAVLHLGFFRKNDGSAIVEFALVAPLFFLLVFAMLEFGLFMYSKMIVENIALEITRAASIDNRDDAGCSVSHPKREDYLACLVKKKASVLIHGDEMQVEFKVVKDGVTVPPDICFDTNPPTSTPATCTVYEEVNGEVGYQGAQISNAGKSGEVIEVRISYPWSVLMPLAGQFFQRTDNEGNTKNVVMITASTVIRNEPF